MLQMECDLFLSHDSVQALSKKVGAKIVFPSSPHRLGTDLVLRYSLGFLLPRELKLLRLCLLRSLCSISALVKKVCSYLCPFYDLDLFLTVLALQARQCKEMCKIQALH